MIVREATKGLYFAVGALSLVLGLTWILLNLHSASYRLDLLIGAVLAAGGLVLLMPHRVRLPGRLTAIVMAVSAVAGTAAGLAVSKSQVCCDVAYLVDRGWPFTWAGRGAVADDQETAVRLASSADWTVSFISLFADLLLFSYAGLLLLVLFLVIRRSKSGQHPIRR
ncbi:hypothetical protein [Actinoplanes sp. NPDC048796]|uniref:hypothetical protein n=1 Tax=unclassified Actinoplanes TaxID=2626549 RepID=UPI0033CDD2DC